ncbi:MAG: metal ABC transporter permease [Candidatus Dormibacteraeota bacterium]|nr:metal ABC transporter permease [Candidatus Dormibacteraeota bacterium]
MFPSFLVDTWVAASVVAVVAGAIGFFCVLRGAAFVAHAVPQGAFAGAAGAALLGLNTLFGLGLFSVLGALTIGWLGRRGRHDVVTALALVTMLGLGALFLSFSVDYEPEIYGLLFGQVLGVAPDQLLPIAALGGLALLATGCLFRPLLWSSVFPEMGQARGVRPGLLDAAFLVVVALTTTLTVPVVGALLTFSLMIAPAGAARCFTAGPLRAALLSIAIALVTVWAAIALGYVTNWPIGFFVGALGAVAYVSGRLYAWRRRVHPAAAQATKMVEA